MSKIIIVSNRLPLEVKINKNLLDIKPSVGGLATGILPMHKNNDSLWIGWTGMIEEDIPCDHLKDDIIEESLKQRCLPVPLTGHEIKYFYEGFSNRTIWPLFHYFTEYTEYDDEFWEVYQSVNRKYADEVLQYAEDGDVIWVHDYQLMLVPQYLKEKNKDLTIGFFLHIPFPAHEIFRLLPYREELIKGILGSDLVGFHTDEYKNHFIETVQNILNCDLNGDLISFDERQIKAGVFPLGVDVEKFEKAALSKIKATKDKSSTILKELAFYKKHKEEVKLILSIDRLDYTKGIAKRIKAFDYFLEHYPQYIGKVRLVMLAVPSRTNVPQYQLLKKEIDELVGNINGKYGNISWTPIWYFYRAMPFTQLMDLYTSCDIALLTPLRDGMNLVAKEYIASRVDKKGVLILSEMTGASNQMKEALIINPNNLNEIARAICSALEMPEKEKIRRNLKLQEGLKNYTVHTWTENFMKTLNAMKEMNNLGNKTRKLTNSHKEQVLKVYKKSLNCVFFLDYDGTLVPFKDHPDQAYPDEQLKKLITDLSHIQHNKVVLISGRDRETLNKWWGSHNITLIAEHGLCLKNNGQDWQILHQPEKSWMGRFKNILEEYVKKVPGSFIEEKQFALVWHYRKANIYTGKKAATELFDFLKTQTEEHNLELLNGNKNIEILYKGINKGITANAYLEKYKDADLVVAIGDDFTDEFMFRELPGGSITIKVGRATTEALYYLENTDEVRGFLKELVNFKQTTRTTSKVL